MIRQQSAPEDSILIYPSHLKYNTSKKQPYVGLIDRLCAFLQQDDAVLFTCGYSFGDDHINERLVTSLRRGANSHVIAMYYDETWTADKKSVFGLAEETNNVRGLRPFKSSGTPHEFKVMSLRECPTPESLLHCDTPDKAAEYWRLHIAAHPYFNPECECFAALLLNTRRRVKGHHLVSIGTQDTLLVHPREVFRVAIVTAANEVIVMHNHPSGESAPSEADIKVTRDLMRAGQLLKMELLDHVIVGNGNFSSLRALGYFYQ